MNQTANTILDEIRACKTPADITAIALSRKGDMDRIKADPDHAVRAIHIRNLAAQRRKQMGGA